MTSLNICNSEILVHCLRYLQNLPRKVQNLEEVKQQNDWNEKVYHLTVVEWWTYLTYLIFASQKLSNSVDPQKW